VSRTDQNDPFAQQIKSIHDRLTAIVVWGATITFLLVVAAGLYVKDSEQRSADRRAAVDEAIAEGCASIRDGLNTYTDALVAISRAGDRPVSDETVAMFQAKVNKSLDRCGGHLNR
jgi:hypothetical protein